MYRVLKRDGTTVDFEITKISAAMIKAFEALDYVYNELLEGRAHNLLHVDYVNK